MNSIPEDVLFLMVNILDVKSSINLINTCSSLKSLNNKDISNKKKVSRLMGLINLGQEHILHVLRKCTRYGYLDMIELLLPEINILNVKVDYFDYIVSLSCEYNHPHIINYYFDRYQDYFGICPFGMFFYSCCNYIISSNDEKFTTKFLKLNINLLNDIVVSTVENGNYEMFCKFYNICKRVCFCDEDNIVVIDGDRFKSFRKNNCVIVGNNIKRSGISEIITGYECDQCCLGTDKYKMIPESHILCHTVLGKSEKILNTLLENGESNYDDGLVGAVKINNKDMINFFIERGADNFDIALKISVNYCYYDLIDFFYNKTKNMSLFTQTIIEDKYNPINFYVNKGFDYEDREDIEDNILSPHVIINRYLERNIDLAWVWILVEVINIIQQKYDYIFKFDYNVMMNSAAKYGRENVIKFCLDRNADINNLELAAACKGKNINIIKLVKNFSFIEYSFVLALESENKDIIEYVFSILDQQYIGNINWLYLYEKLYASEHTYYIQYIKEKCLKRGFDQEILDEYVS
jgi:hypothetical protein